MIKSCVLPEYLYPISAITFWFPDFFRPNKAYTNTKSNPIAIINGTYKEKFTDAYATWLTLYDTTSEIFSPTVCTMSSATGTDV